MLVEMGIADAYGAGFEYAPVPFVQEGNDLSGYVQSPKWAGLVPGKYTDDTQMTVALAELMLAKNPDTWTHMDVADAFVITFRRDQRPGYAGMFYKILQQVRTGGQFLSTVRPHSVKGGGAMRAGVLGLLPNPNQVVQLAMFQASLTHATPIGMHSAAAAALMVHYFHYLLGPREHLGAFIESLVPGDWADQYKGPVNAYGWMPVKAAIWAIQQHDNMADILKACVAYTGDTDTVAAIALVAAAQAEDIDQNLPDVLFDGFEDGRYGSDYLDALDDRLLARFPRPGEDDGDADEASDEETQEADDPASPVAAPWSCTSCGLEIPADSLPSIDPQPEDRFNCPFCDARSSVTSGEPQKTLFDWLC